MHRRRHQHAPRTGLVGAHRHQHRLGQGGRAVVKRGVRHIQPGQTGHHGLVFVEQLQRALTGLGLIRRVGGIKLAARDDGPHRRRNVMLVGAGADEGTVEAVLHGAPLHQAGYAHFRKTFGNAGQAAAIQLGGNLIEQRIGGRCADTRQHGANIAFGMRNEGHFFIGARWQGARYKKKPAAGTFLAPCNLLPASGF